MSLKTYSTIHSAIQASKPIKSNQIHIFNKTMSASPTFKPINIEFLPNGRGGMYYEYNNVPYDYHFPTAWVLSEDRRQEGPNFCETCNQNGFLNGVFICYCRNCSMIYHGEELVAEKLGHNEMITKLPYMMGSTLEDIGLHPAYGILDEMKELAQEAQDEYEQEQEAQELVWTGLEWIPKAELDTEEGQLWLLERQVEALLKEADETASVSTHSSMPSLIGPEDEEQDDETASTHSSMPSLIDLDEEQE